MALFWALLLAVLGCGDDGGSSDAGDSGAVDSMVSDSAGDSAGFDSALDAPADSAADARPPGNTYWISNMGDDMADGSEAAPWDTFSHALAQLTPGDTLVVKAGSRFSAFRYDCRNNGCSGAPCPSGEPGAPITVRAEAPRSVRFRNGTDSAFTLRGCSHIVVEGFELTQEEEMPAGGFETIADIVDADHVVVRDMVIHSINRWINGHMVMMVRSTHVLFEDNELYDFHRGALMVMGSEHVTVRRAYVNSRDRQNLPDMGAYTCCCTAAGDYGIWLDASFDVTVENSIVERTCQSFHVRADDTSLEEPRAGTANRILGSIALDSRTEAFTVNSACDDADPCPEYRRMRDLEIVHSASIRSRGEGFLLNGVSSALLRNVTSIEADQDFDFFVSSANGAIDDASFLVVNALDDGAGETGYAIVDQSEGTILSSNSFDNTTDFDPMFPVTGHGTADPELAGCLVYAPESSPMRGTGAGGEDIGARITHRYVDGRLTAEPLWDPTTGAFPCGPIIADGINDEARFPGGTCSTVHERLNVGAGGCDLP